MRRWTCARWPGRCGGCGAALQPGDVVLEIQIAGVKARLRRCAACEGPAPTELPLEIEIQEPIRLDMTRIGYLPLEPMLAREPGEEG